MDTLPQLVLIAKRILRELRVLSETVRASLSGVKEQIESIAEEQKAHN